MFIKTGVTTLPTKLHLMTESKTTSLVFPILHGQTIKIILCEITINSIIHLLIAVHQMASVKIHRHQEKAGVSPSGTIGSASQLLIQPKLLHVQHHQLILASALHLLEYFPNIEHRVTACELQEVRTSAQSLRLLQTELNHQVLVIPLPFAIIKSVVVYYTFFILYGGGEIVEFPSGENL